MVMDSNLSSVPPMPLDHTAGVPQPRVRILVVDDNLLDVRLCQHILQRAGFEVHSVTDPYIALEWMTQRSFDLLLADIYMPEMDGFELILEAKKRQSELAVLVMTGSSMVEDAIRALERGVDGLILKPFEEGHQLVSAVQHAIVESRQRKDAARLQVLRPLFSATEALNSETHLEILSRLILDFIHDLLQATRAGVFLRQAGQPKFERISDFGTHFLRWDGRGFGDKLLDRVGIPSEDLRFQMGFVDGDVAMLLEEHRLQSVMISSVARGEDVFLFFAGREMGLKPFADADEELFGILARQAAIALENSQLNTELRTTIARLEDSNRALIQSEKMAAVGRLMASVAHEINNPLQAVRNCLHLATHAELSAEEQAEYSELAKSEFDRLAGIVATMMDYYRPANREKEMVALDRLVGKVLDLLDHHLKTESVNVFLECPKDLPPVCIMRNQIQQVIFNLIVNAVEALHDCPGERKIWVEILPGAETVKLAVEDSGDGLTSEMKAHIFEPFFSTKETGTGLGLSICYKIVQDHRGSLSIVPPIHGTGARFELSLPREEA